MRGIVEAGRSSDKGLSARPLNVSSPSALEIRAAISFGAASNNRSTIGRFLTGIAANDRANTWQPSQNLRFGFPSTVTLSSGLQWLDFSIQKFTEVIYLERKLEERVETESVVVWLKEDDRCARL